MRRAGLALFTTVFAGCGSDVSRTVEPTNVLLIIADDLGFTDIGAYGGEIRTPNLDALAASGVRFAQFHTAPQCAPTRAMLYSGNNNHVAGADPNGPEARLSSRVVPFPALMKDAGYRTLFVGKWHLGTAAAAGPDAAGFERSFALAHGAANHFNAVGMSESGSIYREDGRLVDYPDGAFTTELFTDRLIEFIEEDNDDGRPFLAVASYTAPHWPLQVPPEDLGLYAGRYDAGYDDLRTQRLEGAKRAGVIDSGHSLPLRDPDVVPWDDLSVEDKRVEARKMELLAAMVENLDRHVGRLLDYLRDSGRYENTLIIFMSDNGANSADHFESGQNRFLRRTYDNSLENMGRPTSWVSIGPEWAEASTAPFSRYKVFTRQGGMVSPLMITGPGVSQAGTVSAAFVTVMDIAPTLLEVAGTTYPSAPELPPMLGESLMGVLTGAAPAVHADDYVTALLHNGRAFMRQGRWKLVTLDRPFDEGRFELYDIVADPGETTDLRESMPDRFQELLDVWRATSRDVGVILPNGS